MYLKALVYVLIITSSFDTIVQVDSLKISAFNIQVFGKTKSSKMDVMDLLERIISLYDIILIQEIRDSAGTAINTLLDRVNTQNTKNPFSMKISERLGRTTSKEQYAFFYREGSGLKVVADYTYNDNSADEFEREPYVVLFKSSNTVIDKFAIAGIHVDPDDAVKEITALEKVFDNIKSKWNINNVMIMGDLNADCSYVPNYKWRDINLKQNSQYDWLIGDDIDTTVSATDCAYDRFIVTGDGFKSYPNGGLVAQSAKVLRFDQLYSLNATQARAVSDHYPIELELTDITSSSTVNIYSWMILTIVICMAAYVSR